MKMKAKSKTTTKSKTKTVLFQSCHPVVHLIYFATVIICTVIFDHPCFLLCAFLCTFVCNAVVTGKKGVVYSLLVVLLAIVFTLFYAGYTHFGVTVLSVNFIGNRITLESLIRGAVTGVKAAGVLMWCNVLHAVMTTDEIVYLFGKLAPKLSLYSAILLRTVPWIREEREKIRNARRNAGITRNCIAEFFSCAGILVSAAAEHFSDSADSMRARGYTLKDRTAFPIYRFDNRDRLLVLFMFFAVTVLAMAVILGDTAALYSSVVSVTVVTVRKFVFSVVYAMFSLLPCALR